LVGVLASLPFGTQKFGFFFHDKTSEDAFIVGLSHKLVDIFHLKKGCHLEILLQLAP